MDDDLPVEVWLMAVLRRCSSAGIPAFVTHRGADGRGTVMVKINAFENGCRVLTQTRDIDGRLCWMDPYEGEAADEAKIDAYLKRAIERDPDVWAVEVEDRQGRNPFE